jgi:hypothetical protein
LIALGTRATTLGTDPELAADDEALVVVELAADDDELLLLLPQPTIAAALSSDMATESQLLRVRIALLLIECGAQDRQHCVHRGEGLIRRQQEG